MDYDYNCRDIPMRLDVNHQPLNFDIYLSQVIDVPKTSLDEAPYDFRLEHEALRLVDGIIERTTDRLDDLTRVEDPNIHNHLDKNPILIPTTVNHNNQQCNSQAASNSSSPTSMHPLDIPTFPDQSRPIAASAPTTSDTAATLPASCPIETPLTPVKCSIEPATNNTVATTSSLQINPRDFEEIHYNPFDQLELQTIDELRELKLVFQASYANQASKQ